MRPCRNTTTINHINMNNEIKNSLKNLGFRNNEIKVYMALTSLGEANAAEIAKKADLPRTTAISILEKLKEDNYLTTHKYRGTTSYWIESPQTLVNIFEHKIDIANSLGELLNKEYRQEAHFPFAETYDTKTGIRQYIEKFLCKLNKNSTIYTIDSPKSGNYAKIFSDKMTTNKFTIVIKLVQWKESKKKKHNDEGGPNYSEM